MKHLTRENLVLLFWGICHPHILWDAIQTTRARQRRQKKMLEYVRKYEGEFFIYPKRDKNDDSA